jgi:Protein of unknown function (DUF2637)
MTVIDEAPTRNGSVVDSQRPASPGAATIPASPPTATPSDSNGDSGPGQKPRRRRARPEDTFVDAETAAAARSAEHFFRGWLIVATAISIVANVAHAWWKASDDIRIGAALTALVPPVILLVQTHFVFKLIKARRFGVDFAFSLLLTVVIGFFAFYLSYEAIRDLVVMLGTSPDRAGMWPVVIDLSILNSALALFTITRSRSRGLPSPTIEPEPAASGEVGGNSSRVAMTSLSLTERVMMWDRAASVVKERNPDVRAITERSTSQIADVLRLTHDEGTNQRTIAEMTGLNDRIVRTIQRAGQDVLGRTDPRALQID